MTENATWAVISIGIIALSIVIALIVVALSVRRRRKEPPLTVVDPEGSTRRDITGRVWVVANPTKPDDYEEFRLRVGAAVMTATGKPVMLIETSEEDPGTGQTIEALKHLPSLVIAAGGDGTVRAVAAGLAHSRVPMGLLPMGTGNLLARNLGIPLDLDMALTTALSPTVRQMDLAWLRLERAEEESPIPAEGGLLKQAGAKSVRSLPEGLSEPHHDEFAYAVIAGAGFDGETMAHTTSDLKKKVGWSAYVLTALRSLHIERMKATITVFHKEGEDASSYEPRLQGRIPKAVEEAVRHSHTIGSSKGVSPANHRSETWDMTSVRARTILFANCGTLPFAVLAPNASLDDGALDVIAIDTRGGLLGWVYLSAKVFGQSMGMKPVNVKNDPGSIQFRQTDRARLDISKPYPVQVDGDAIGSARTVHVRVDPGALIIRVPRDPNGAKREG